MNSYYNIIDLSIIHYSNSCEFYIPHEIRKIIKEYTYKEINDKNIHSAVKLWYHNKEKAIILYGHISYWDTSKVTDMSNLFMFLNNFNDKIDNWDVSQVTNMQFMFYNASLFNQPIGNWNVSKVNNMSRMFNYASSFNQPIGDWNVTNVIYMRGMFYNASSFNQPIGNWNISQITNMESNVFQCY